MADNIVLWRGLIDIGEISKKGNSVYIEGKISTRKWEDKDGNTRYSTDIIADKMTMLGCKTRKYTFFFLLIKIQNHTSLESLRRNQVMMIYHFNV